MTSSTVERTDSPDLSDAYPTVALLARQWAQNQPDQIAMRDKDFGIWHERTRAQLWDEISTAAHGLLALGVTKGDVVSIHSEDRPEWIILDLATVAIRAITTGLYATNPTAEVTYLLNDAGAVVHFAEDQEQVDKVIDAGRDAFASVRTVLYVEPRGLRNHEDDRLMFWDDFMELGRQHRNESPAAVELAMADALPEDVATLIYTSGTTGPPKGAMLSNRNITFCMDTLIDAPGRFPGGPITPNDIGLTYLPLAHVAERIFSTWSMTSQGLVLNFAESIETVQVNLREVQPTVFFAVPRIWERIYAAILIRMADASRFKTLVNGVGMWLAGYIGRARVANGGEFTIGSKLAYWIGNPISFRSLKEKAGLRHCRWAASGAAPIAPEVLVFFMGLGIPVFELYGMTENAAVATTNFPGRVKVGTVGEPYEGIGLRLDEATGEIQTKSPADFVGYWHKPEKTAETFTDDGWLKTGDVGEWVDGTHIKIVDRMKDIIITSGGKNISPSEIENSLKTSPLVKEAMVIGDGRKFVTALIAIEYDVVGNWALARSIPYTTYRDLSEKPEVIERIQRVVDETNEKFAHLEQIRKFRMIPKELDHEDGELTATQKIKRNAMEDLFGDLIADMYQ
ncbi:MAG: AMP-dependent synthetase/ligase [Acidimicrobiia bacterium]|nr:MAG: AMP-dependent synthetase/ligase [Acidimicrobiia bacterium]